MRWLIGAALAASACAEPVIEMRLEMPPADQADAFSVGCVGSVEVFARGVDRGADDDDNGRPADDLDQCVEVSGATSFNAIRAAIAGRFELALPESGLAGIEIRGSTGTCNKSIAPGDPIFYGSGKYVDGRDIVIDVKPNVSCNATRAETVRAVDLLALTRTGVCPPPLPDGLSGVDSATIHPGLMSDAVLDFNNDSASTLGGVSTLPVYTGAQEDSCVALAFGENGPLTTASCVRRGTGVCSAAGQLELPVIDGNIAYASLDLVLLDQFGGGAVLGGVWGTDATGTKVRLAGATVRPKDAAHGKVVYADYTANAPKLTSLTGATATNASGLFIAYVTAPMDFTISAPGYRDETVRLASPEEPSTSLILLARR